MTIHQTKGNTMPRAVSTVEAKNTLTALIAWVREHRDAVVVENRGKPSAVLLSYDEYERMKVLEEQQRRQEAVARLQRLRNEVRERNQDLSDEGAEAIADRFSREFVADLAREGKVRFQQ